MNILSTVTIAVTYLHIQCMFMHMHLLGVLILNAMRMRNYVTGRVEIASFPG